MKRVLLLLCIVQIFNKQEQFKNKKVVAMEQFIKNVIICVSCILLFSCNKKENPVFFSISVNTNENSSLPLSEITEKIEVIELEVTDESLISRVLDVLDTDDYYIIRETTSVMLFDKKGKFFRKIGSIGQGPGEYVNIIDIAVDNKKEKIFICTNTSKIICYDINGKFLKETPNGYYKSLKNITFINGRLLAFSDQMDSNEKDLHNIILYSIEGENLSITDTLMLTQFRSVYSAATMSNDFILNDGSNICLFYTDFASRTIVFDTMYCINKHFHVTPYLKLNLTNEGYSITGDKDIYMFNIYKSSRFVFAHYRNKNIYSYFCYDTKTEKGYNMENGYIDDIHTMRKNVRIRPFDSDANKFYYSFTNINESDNDEPNPTLYVGTLKK